MPTDRTQDVETIRAALRWVPWHRVVAPELGSPHTPIQSEANAALDRLLAREKTLNLVAADYDRRMETRWGRFLLWLLRKTT